MNTINGERNSKYEDLHWSQPDFSQTVLGMSKVTLEWEVRMATLFSKRVPIVRNAHSLAYGDTIYRITNRNRLCDAI